MRDSRLEELISAYVDGELSSDERLLVERELEQSSDSRQLFEQLQMQRGLLQSLPRVRLPSDFSHKIVRRLEGSKVALPSIETRRTRKTSVRRLTLNVMLGASSVLAAGLLISMVLRDSNVEKNPLQPPKNHLGVQPDVAPELRLAAFEQRFPMLAVYELTVTPKGRQNKIVDQCLKAAGIEIDKSIAIDERVEQRLLESRFIAKDLISEDDAKKEGVSKSDIEMILVRGRTKRLGEIGDQLFKLRGAPQDEIQMSMNLAMSKELAIFLQLNDAVDGQGVLRQVSSDTWSKPGAFRLKFRYAFNTKNSAASIKTTAVPVPNIAIPVDKPAPSNAPPLKVAVNADEKSKRASGVDLPQTAPPVVMAGANDVAKDENEATQVLIIIRHLDKNVVFPAVGVPGK